MYGDGLFLAIMSCLATKKLYYFSPTMAAHFGLYEAIILQFLSFVKSEDSDGRVLEDGHRYCYNTYSDWKKLYPFISERTLQRTMTSMEERGLICAKQPDGYNRQKYYRISEWMVAKDASGFFDILPSCQNGELEPSCQNGMMEYSKLAPCTIVHKTHESFPAINAGREVLKLNDPTLQPKKRGRPPKPTDPRHQQFIDVFSNTYLKTFGEKYYFQPKDAKQLQGFLKSCDKDLDELVQIVTWCWEKSKEKFCPAFMKASTIFDFCQNWPRIVVEAQKTE